MSYKFKPINLIGNRIPQRTELEIPIDLTGLFNSIDSFIWTNSRVKNKKEIFMQFLYVLFLKIYDERSEKEPSFYILGSEYEEILNNSKENTFSNRIMNLFNDLKNNEEFLHIFNKSDNIMLEPRILAEIVYRLQRLKLEGSDVKGEAFQVFLSPYYRGENDQYLTPLSVIQMMISLVKPTIDDYIIDPTCGTGRFLIQFIKEVLVTSNTKSFNIDREWAREHVFGIDIDKTLVKITRLYLALLGIPGSKIFNVDSIQHPIERYKVPTGKITLSVTNPPFGTAVKVTSNSILKNYSLGFKWNKKLIRSGKINEKGQSQGVLVMERCFQFLKEGGILAIVLPDGILSNLNDNYIRKWIVTNMEVLAIISLPEETFRVKTIGANVKTSVLIGKKVKEPLERHKIFFADPKSIGYDILEVKKESNEVLEVPRHYHERLEIPKKYFWLDVSNLSLIDRMDVGYYRERGTDNNKKNHISLGDYCDIFIGKTPSKTDYLDAGKIKILKVRALTNFMIDWSDRKRDYVDEHWYKARNKDLLDIYKGDIVLACAAHVGKYIGNEIDIIDAIPEKYERVIASAKIVVIRVKDTKKLNPYVLVLYLRTLEAYKEIQSKIRGQTAEIYPQDLLDIKIPAVLLKISEKEGMVLQNRYENNLSMIRTARTDNKELETKYGFFPHENILHDTRSIVKDDSHKKIRYMKVIDNQMKDKDE